MKYLKQFAIILAVCLAGEGLKALLPLPIPASIYGLVLMLAALMSGLLKLEQVENAADYLIQIMSPMFIPAAVGLMDQFASLRAILLPFLVINLVGLVITFAVTGRVTQFLLNREKGAKK
ncbi:MAG: CidA/LrgA family protein [Clostridia bacterium]|nr:CidA/LrgA family protein [Clostridia bacterium]